MKQLVWAFGVAAFLFSVQSKAQAPFTKKERKEHERIKGVSQKYQSVEISRDTIFSSGKAYGIIRKDMCDLFCAYSIFSLNGKELILIERNDKFNGSYFKFLVDKIEPVPVRNVLLMAREVARIVAVNDLLTPTGVNKASVERFRLKYAPAVIQQKPDSTRIRQE